MILSLADITSFQPHVLMGWMGLMIGAFSASKA